MLLCVSTALPLDVPTDATISALSGTTSINPEGLGVKALIIVP